MASDERLRREIAQLSNLIASSKGENTTVTTQHHPNGVRTVSHFSIRPYPSSSSGFRQSLSSSSFTRPTTTSIRKPFKLVRYPNPFDKYSNNDNYLSQVFPSSLQNGGVVSSSNPSPYKLNNNRSNGNVVAKPSSSVIAPPQPSVENGVQVKVEPVADKPMQIYINPSYLAKMNAAGQSSLDLQQQQTSRVRPHINPAHSSFQSLANAHVNSNFVPATTAPAVNYQFSSLVAQPSTTTILSSSTNNCDNRINCMEEEVEECMEVMEGNSRPLTNSNGNGSTSQYKLDRRDGRKPSPTKMKLFSYKLPVISNPWSSKLFKRYSMRRVGPVLSNKFSLSNNNNWHGHQRKLVASSSSSPQPSFKKKLSKLQRKGVRKGRRKSVVQIDGSDFIRKNGGKTLKRVKVNVVSINGNRFIRKNGGKSLKRLSESLSTGKPLLILSQQQQTPGVRLANRAVLKSKLTLSQRIWKKKQLCVFYNRFGECKRKEDGSCPYIHDRKHLLICPKFIVGKCTNKDCKLSHDLKVGRMPPCQFFNKSECSRENCPYPHVKSSPVVKNPSKTVNPSVVTSKKKSITTPTSRKRKLSSRKDSSSKSPKSKKTGKSQKKDPKARYYEQSPVSQPIVSIIPLRLPKEIPTAAAEEEEPNKKPSVPKSSNEASSRPTTSSTEENGDGGGEPPRPVQSNLCAIASDATTNGDGDVGVVVLTANESRRMRLMSKISRLHERVKKKESTVPQFLPFN